MRRRSLLVLLALVGIVVVGAYAARKEGSSLPAPDSTPLAEPPPIATPVEPPSPEPSLMPPPPAPQGLLEPVGEFKSRITKKPFGIFITPETSPVQPERFRGYHNAVDVEYEDVAADVPVVAISDGTVVVSRTASGYGGVMVVRHTIEKKEYLVLYGHLDPKVMRPVDATMKRGEQLAILGDHKSAETDGERKHLHFAILAKSSVDLRGYVQTKDELSGWHDPLSFYD